MVEMLSPTPVWNQEKTVEEDVVQKVEATIVDPHQDTGRPRAMLQDETIIPRDNNNENDDIY